jgi:hypothetical protein
MATKWSQPAVSVFMEWLKAARAYFVGGAVLSLIGFALPWFKFDESAQWWYGGFWLMVGEGLPWLLLMFVGYGILVLAGSTLLKQGPQLAGVVAALSLTVALSGLVVVSLAMADAIEGVRTLDRLVWNIGLLIMLPSHAVMVFGAFAVWVLRAVEESFGLIDEA